MSTDELLAVLDMPEDEQLIWCAKNAGLDLLDATLADLAFRLRDEAVWHISDEAIPHWENALKKIYVHLFSCLEPETEYAEKVMWRWWFESAKPIHIIIAALIAKEKQ